MRRSRERHPPRSAALEMWTAHIVGGARGFGCGEGRRATGVASCRRIHLLDPRGDSGKRGSGNARAALAEARRQRMKKLINAVDGILQESLQGFCEAHSDIV